MAVNLTDFFKPVVFTPTLPRLAISLDGKDKCGKTHYALFTAPQPIRIVSTDFGTQYVIEKALSKKVNIAGVMDLQFKEPDAKKTKADEEGQVDWRREWYRFKSSVEALVDEPKGPKRTRTFIADTGTGLYKLCRLALFGKAKSIPPKMFDQVDSEMAEVFWNLYKGRPDLNLIFIHHKKKKYVNDSWDGAWERDGWNKIAAAVDVVIQAGWDKSERSFYTEVAEEQATRMGGHLAGKKFVGSENSFKVLGMEAIEETQMTPEVWD